MADDEETEVVLVEEEEEEVVEEDLLGDDDDGEDEEEDLDDDDDEMETARSRTGMQGSSNAVATTTSGSSSDEAVATGEYGGIEAKIYDAILLYRRDGIYPTFADLRKNRNAHFHWRARCKFFFVSPSGDRLLYYGSNTNYARVVVRKNEVYSAIKVVHERAGHVGIKQTFARLTSRLYWRNMRRDVIRFVTSCGTCLRKQCATRQKPEEEDFSDSHLSAARPPGALDEATVVERLMLNMTALEVHDLVLHAINDQLVRDQLQQPVTTRRNAPGRTRPIMEQAELVAHYNAFAPHLEAARRGNEEFLDDDEDGEKQHLDDEMAVAGCCLLTTTTGTTTTAKRSSSVMSEPKRMRLLKSPPPPAKATGSLLTTAATRRGGRPPRRSHPQQQHHHVERHTLSLTNAERRATMRALQTRLRVEMMEGAGAAALQLPPATEAVAEQQRRVLRLQEEVLLLQRVYFRHRLEDLGYVFEPDDDGAPPPPPQQPPPPVLDHLDDAEETIVYGEPDTWTAPPLSVHQHK